jgi:hypothetical protein
MAQPSGSYWWNWIYDGNLLGVEEQEEVAGQITGHRKEMNELLRSIGI